jgi:hypothetical protein
MMLCGDTVYKIDSDKVIDQELETTNANTYTQYKRNLIDRISKMITQKNIDSRGR